VRPAPVAGLASAGLAARLARAKPDAVAVIMPQIAFCRIAFAFPR
jgi:hypothetical protein